MKNFAKHSFVPFFSEPVIAKMGIDRSVFCRTPRMVHLTMCKQHRQPIRFQTPAHLAERGHWLTHVRKRVAAQDDIKSIVVERQLRHAALNKMMWPVESARVVQRTRVERRLDPVADDRRAHVFVGRELGSPDHEITRRARRWRAHHCAQVSQHRTVPRRQPVLVETLDAALACRAIAVSGARGCGHGSFLIPTPAHPITGVGRTRALSSCY